MVTYKLFSSINSVPNTWDELTVSNLFFSTSFLKATELAIPNNIKPYYLGVFNDNILCGIAILQHVDFNLGASLKDARSFFKKQLHKCIKFIAKGQIIVLGNLLQTGQNSYFFNEALISNKDFFNAISLALKDLKLLIKTQTKTTVKCIVLKDYTLNDSIHNNFSFLQENKFFAVSVQPNMVLNIPQNWNNFKDYEKALTKKYRRRFTTAKKKKNNIELKCLSLEDIEYLEEKLFNLYNSVASNAAINLFKLPKNHFTIIKKNLNEDFIVYGYFMDNELLGFFSLLRNNTVLDTYFLGYNSSLNHSYQIYLNMLYDMICYGIDANFKSIVFARTAMEIKSSVGAKPEDMVMFMKHTNSILNIVLKWCVKVMTPKKHWEERHPFL